MGAREGSRCRWGLTSGSRKKASEGTAGTPNAVRVPAGAAYKVAPMPTIAQLLAEARPRLAATAFGAPPREAALLLGWLLNLSEAQILAHGEREVPVETTERFRSLLE